MTSTRCTAFPDPAVGPGSTQPDRVLVLVGAGRIPDWVVRWCRQSAQQLCRQPAPSSAPAGCPPPAEEGDAIADIAATAAHTGAGVLVLREPEPPRRGRPQVVVAVRDLPDDAQVLADAVAAAAHMRARLVVAHGVPMSFGERSMGLDAALEHGRSLIDTAVRQACAADPRLTVEPSLARVHPHELVGEGLDADLLVLGGPRAGVSGEVGLVARSALHHAPCAVLLSPRPAHSSRPDEAPRK